MMLSLSTTNKPSFCAKGNEYHELINWKEFASKFNTDSDSEGSTLLVRYDLDNCEDDSGTLMDNEFILELNFLVQDKGYMRTVTIKNISEKDVDDINSYLEEASLKIKELWEEFL